MKKFWNEYIENKFDLVETFREVWVLLRSNLLPGVSFLLIFIVFSSFINELLYNIGYYLSNNLTGVYFLTNDNLFSVFKNPINIVILFLIYICMSGLALFEIAGIMHLYSMSKNGKKTTISGMAEAAMHAYKRCLNPNNWPLMIYFCFVLPFVNVIYFSSDTYVIGIPGFIRDAIRGNALYTLMFRVVYLALLVFVVLHIFMMNYYTLNDDSFFDSCRKARKLIKDRIIRTIVIFLGITFFDYLVFTAISGTLSDLIYKVSTVFVDYSGYISKSAVIAKDYQYIGSFLRNVISPVINIGVLSVLFYKYLEEDENPIDDKKRNYMDIKLSKAKLITIVTVIVMATGFKVAQLYPYITDTSEYNRPLVIAHRGDSFRAPENSIPAFSMAILENADGVELDTYLTKDGELVVSHDDDLLRVSGQNLYVHELTYDELQEVDTGSWFSEDFSYLRLSKLSDVLALFKDNDMTIQIEIKACDYSDGIEEKLVQVINESGIKDRITVISLVEDYLIRVKEIDESITTAYCLYIAWDNVQYVDYVDDFSIEVTNIEPPLVDKIHATGSKVYCWTVNDENAIQYLSDCGVDGILCDDPLMVINALDRIETSKGLARFFRLIFVDKIFS